MKILVLSQYWWPENGVPQRRWTWLSKILADSGHHISVLAPPPHYQRKIALRDWWRHRKQYNSLDSSCVGKSGEYIYRTGFFPAGQSLTSRAFNQLTVAFGAMQSVTFKRGFLRSYRPDLIIGTVPALPTLVATYWASVRLGVPYVIDLRDAWPDLLNDSESWNEGTGHTSFREKVLRLGAFQLVRKLTWLVFDSVLKKATAIMVTSSYLADELEERLEDSKDRNSPPVIVIRNVFPVESVQWPQPRNLTGRKTLNVLYAGTLGRAQNLSNAIEAARLAQQRGIEVKLRIVGAGVAKSDLMERALNAGVDASFERRRSSSDLSELYEWAETALVHLTGWSALGKAVPSKTYELMEKGIHITAVVRGETAELVTQLEAGHVVAPEQPLELARLWEKLAGDKTLLRVGEEGREWVQRERDEIAPRRLRQLFSMIIR